MNNIQYYRIKAGLTQNEFAKKLHAGQSSVSQWESGKRAPSIEVINRIAEVLNVKPSMLLEPIPHDTGQKEIDKPSAPTFSADAFYAPLVATLRCGFHESGAPIYDEFQKIELPASFKDKYGKDIVLIKAIGESMLPLIRPRDMLICKPGTEWIDGNIVVVNVDDSDTVKRIYRAKDGGIDLVPENPSYKKMHFTPDDLITYPPHVLGRVVRNYGQDL